jgi:cytochrome c553
MYVVNITLQMLKPSRLIGEHLLLMHLLVLSATFAIFSAGDRTAFGEDVVEFSPAQLEFFEKQVRPILVKRCYKCHSSDTKKPQGALRVDSRMAMLAGGDTGAAIIPGNAKESLLIDAINHGDVYQMPPKSKMPAAEIAVLTKWVDQNAPWPKEEAKVVEHAEAFDIEQRKSSHWCWQPIKNYPAPTVQNAAWSKHPVDAFILRKLEASKLTPAKMTSKNTLIRRAYFDLIGLPPTPQQIREFIHDSSPQAFEKVIDELLESPHFGERWARHWMDLVRYAESRGHEFDYSVANPHHYRDYLIRAFNADLPYGQFVREHIAGDLIENPRLNPEDGSNESVLGTGFWFFGEWIHSPVDIRKDETDRFDNMVDVFSKSFLGVTVACARCHDHKFDAITQADYYALFGYLQSSAYRQVRFDSMHHNQGVQRKLEQLRRDSAAQIAKSFRQAATDVGEQSDEYLLASKKLLQEGIEIAKIVGESDILFADFERGNFEGWTASGDAFGDAPQTLESVAAYQGPINGVGKFFINTHNVQRDGKLVSSDSLTGTLTSKPFKIERDRIEFWIGGGAHQGKTCVNLLIDEKVVLSATGRNNNQMFKSSWDVKSLKGKTGQIQVVDAHKEGWGNVGLDHVVFTSESIAQAPNVKIAAVSVTRIQAVAKELNLDGALLEQWVKSILAARNDEANPLNLWARICLDDGDVAQLIANVVANWKSQQEKDGQLTDGVVEVVNYQSSDAEWLQDGVLFGGEPRRTGQLRVAEAGAADELGAIQQYGAAIRDSVFNGLRLAAGTGKEAGRLAGWDRAGRALRTRTFELSGGTVHFLVRGKGRSYAVVDSHRTINGPLHGALLRDFDVDIKGEPKWVSHSVGGYNGHKLHMEFIATGDDPLEILQVVCGPRAPAVPGDVVAEDIISGVDKSKANLERIAAAYRQAIANALPKFGEVVQDRGAANLQDWMLKNAACFIKDLAPLSKIGASHREQFATLKQEVRLESRTALAMWDGSGDDEHLLIRGNSRTPGEVVSRGMLEAIDGKRQATTASGSGRLQLAERIMAPTNPLTSRVMVNRIWHHLFGQGIVASVDNFGVLGRAPTHPELLDHLAVKFAREGWSTKSMIRHLMLSNSYQMDSQPNPAAADIDPNNDLLHRGRVRRLQGEAIRDSMLLVSGRLDRKQFGPSVNVYLTEFMQGRGRPGGGPLDGDGRRSIYVSIRRNFLSPMMLAFDTPQPFNAVGKRNVSNVPAQALILMNDPFVVEQAKKWGTRIATTPDRSVEQRIQQSYWEGFGRPASDAEVATGKRFVVTHGLHYGLDEQASEHSAEVWGDYCHVLMNVKDFIFID